MYKLNSKDLPIFVINLDNDKHRWDFMKSQFEFLKATNVNRFSGTDMRKVDLNTLYKDDRVSLYTKFTIQKKHRCDHKQIDTTGAIGCTLSHYSVWKKIVDENIDMAIIFEDDIRLMSNFFDILNKEIKENINFDILNLGYMKNAYSNVDDSIFYFGAGCYVVTKKACEILCKYVFPIDTHVDAYFFLLNHFNYLKMVMSNEMIAFPQSGINSNIEHGNLQCVKNTSEITNTKIVIKEIPGYNYSPIFFSLCILILIVFLYLLYINHDKCKKLQ
jgi:GR25 family glycosyltransferase involved in LPS biosynthesis